MGLYLVRLTTSPRILCSSKHRVSLNAITDGHQTEKRNKQAAVSVATGLRPRLTSGTRQALVGDDIVPHLRPELLLMSSGAHFDLMLASSAGMLSSAFTPVLEQVFTSIWDFNSTFTVLRHNQYLLYVLGVLIIPSHFSRILTAVPSVVVEYFSICT